MTHRRSRDPQLRGPDHGDRADVPQEVADERPVIPAAGTVLWRPGSRGALEVAVVHRPRYDDWSLPKGKLDPGETTPVAALRETEEETGFSAVLGRFLSRIEYDARGGPKTVDYFSARATTGQFQRNSEVDELRWLTPEKAEAALSYHGDVTVLNEFASLPAKLTTVLLVRHAKAGDRQSWSGDDDLRPLTREGQEQAAALRSMLRPFSPDRVFSAPRLRCVQTVRGIADDAGVAVAHEPLLSQTRYPADPSAGNTRLRDIAAVGGTSVVCSQGEVIPNVVHALAEADGVRLPPSKPDGGVGSKKSSVWLLSFTPRMARMRPKLVAATYLPSPLPPLP